MGCRITKSGEDKVSFWEDAGGYEWYAGI